MKKLKIKNIFNNKKIYLLLTSILSILLLAVSTYSHHTGDHTITPQDLFDLYPVSRQFDPSIAPWYTVSPSELAFCQADGGTQVATTTVSVVGAATFVSQTTASVQAIIEPAQDATTPGLETFPDGNVNYKISYYVSAFQVPVEFSIRLKNTTTPGPGGRMDVVLRTVVQPGTSDFNFVTVITNQEFDAVKMRIDETITITTDPATVLQVQIIDEDYSGTCALCGTGQTTDPWTQDW